MVNAWKIDGGGRELPLMEAAAPAECDFELRGDAIGSGSKWFEKQRGKSEFGVFRRKFV